MATQERAAGDWKEGARAYDPNGDSSAIAAEARDVAVPDPQVLALRDMAGQSLVRSQTSYITAMRVTKERDLETVRKKLMSEATFGQDGWYYSWTQAGQVIEGGTIGLAERVLSLYGNMVANAEVKSWMGNRVLFHAVAIDLESGATFESDYLATMAPAPAKYARDEANKERWYQMQFQSHKSRALRDVIFRLAPRWLVDLAVAEAKKMVESKIDSDKVIEAREAALKMLRQQYGVSPERVLAALEVKTVGEIGAKEVATLRGFYSALKNGERTAEEVFGVDEEKAPKKAAPVTAEYQATPAPGNGGAPAQAETTEPQPLTDETRQALVERAASSKDALKFVELFMEQRHLTTIQEMTEKEGRVLLEQVDQLLAAVATPRDSVGPAGERVPAEPPNQLAQTAQEAPGPVQPATPATAPVEPGEPATPSAAPSAAKPPEQPILEPHLKALAMAWAPHLGIKPDGAEVLLRSRNLSVQAGIELVNLTRGGNFDLKRFGELTGIPLNI